MAKGNGSDYENLEDEENINDDYCEPGDEFNDSIVEGDSQTNYEELAEDDGEDYHPASKRGKCAANFRGPRGRSVPRNDFLAEGVSGGGGGGSGSRNGSRGSASRFRATRGFGRGENASSMFRGGLPSDSSSAHFTAGARGGARFRGAPNWDTEWNSAATNDGQRGIPSLMGSIGAPVMPPHMVMNNGYQSGSSPYTNPMPQIPGVKSSQESEEGEQDSLQAPGVTNAMNSVYGSITCEESLAITCRNSDMNDSVVADDYDIEIWVETKTAEGKSYYYNAKSRDTTWTKPDGENIKIILQEQVEAMAAAAGVSSSQQLQRNPNENNLDENSEATSASVAGSLNLSHMMRPGNNMPPPNTMQPPPGMMPPPFGAPPFGGPPPFGMPPPGFPPSAFPGGFQPSSPWGFPQPGMSMQSPMIPPNMMAPGAYPPSLPMSMATIESFGDRLSAEIDPSILNRAAEWSEHKAPDGRSYYYNVKAGESVWEKPQALKDLDVAKLAAARNNSAVIDKPPLETSTSTMVGGNNHSIVEAKRSSSSDKRLAEDFEKITEEKRDDGIGNEEDKNIGMKAKDRPAELDSDDASRKISVEDDKLLSKVQDKSKPVSSTPVPGTPWCVVWTGDGRVFFYNPSARTSVWERPEELIGRSDVTKMISTPPAVVIALKKENQEITDGNSPVEKIKLDSSGSQEQEERSNAVASKEEPKLSSVANSSIALTGTSEKHQINVGKEAAMEAEVRAARERAVVPLETRIHSFREMLSEKEVSAFSTWEKELHKIVFDPRYLLLTSKERKQVFEKYVKERAEEERQEKRNRMKQRKEDYRKLMENANLHGKSSFNEFSSKYAKDERFKNIEKVRERESLFNEFILEVRKREKDEKNYKREQIRKDFMELLREHAEIDRHSRWSDVKKKIDSDSRYKMVDSSSLREDYFRDYIRILKDEKRHKEKERTRKERVEKDKDQESDPELANASDTERDKDAEKAARVEASLREREKEVQRTLAVHLRDRDNEREQHKHDEAVHHFNALLADLVRNSELSWREVKRLLRKDHRWDLADLLDRDEKEKLFNEHIEQLTKKKREKFRELLDDTPNLTINSSWKEIRRLIKDDPRYVKFSSSERKCEKEFKEYMKDKLVTIKSDFRELLQETKLITHKSYSLVKENDNNLKEIEDILKNDRRYLILDHIPEERKELLLSYLDDLEKRGPPPPPTASEPSRRIIK